MLLKYIQHFVTQEGSTFFPKWFADTHAKMQIIPGFVTGHFIPDAQDPCHIHLFLYFKDEGALTRWTKANAHESVLKTLEPYWSKPFIMTQALL